MSTQSKHTPGPWGFNVGKNGTVDGLPAVRIYSDIAGDMVLDFAHANGDQDIANARLIAAAPGLLTMLQRVLDEICMTEEGMRHVAPLTLEQAREAIATAEGIENFYAGRNK